MPKNTPFKTNDSSFRAFIECDGGSSLIEYGLISVLGILLSMGSLMYFDIAVMNTFNESDSWVVSAESHDSFEEEPPRVAQAVVAAKCILTGHGAFTPGYRGGPNNPLSICDNPTLGRANNPKHLEEWEQEQQE
ncbi:MAG: hypothetical protein HN348_18365 [Proteobacteria bacterium]|nr:hypothetical protein [Pseudomonadota bacterium]